MCFYYFLSYKLYVTALLLLLVVVRVNTRLEICPSYRSIIIYIVASKIPGIRWYNLQELLP
jgi:hypothetical protein